MKTQIAVRLEDDAVRFLDDQVAEGHAVSRAELIGRLVAREARRQQALKDIETMRLAGVAGYPDLVRMHEVAARRPIELD